MRSTTVQAFKLRLSKAKNKFNSLGTSTKVVVASSFLMFILASVFATNSLVANNLNGNGNLTSNNSIETDLQDDKSINLKDSAKKNTDDTQNTTEKDENASSDTSKVTSNTTSQKKNTPANGSATTSTPRSLPTTTPKPTQPTPTPTQPTPTPTQPSLPDYNLNNNLHSAVVNGMNCSIPISQVTEENETDYCVQIPGDCSRFYGVGTTSSEAESNARIMAESSLTSGSYFLPKCGAGGPLTEDECTSFSLSCGRW